MGLIFMTMSLMSLVVLFFVSSEVSEPYENYDYKAIQQNGVEKQAVITGLGPLSNVSVNGQNPVVISYDYKGGTRTVSDKFQTFNLEKTLNYKQGDTLTIKTYNNESAVVGLEPYSFPLGPILIGPGIFLIVGSIFFLIGFIPALKIYRLYQNGIVKEATVFSMYIDSGTSRSNFGKSIIVNYHYLDSRSNKVAGTSYTSDLSIMQHIRPDDIIKIFVSEIDEIQSTMVPKKLAVKNGWRV